MDSRASSFCRVHRCARAILVWLVVAALMVTQVPYAQAEEAPVGIQDTVETPSLSDGESGDPAIDELDVSGTEDDDALDVPTRSLESESSDSRNEAPPVEDKHEANPETPMEAFASPSPVTGFTDVSTGGFLPRADSARNLAIIVRFAGDATGDGETGYNAPFAYRDDIRSQWEYFIKQFNENDPSAYVTSSFREYFYQVSDGQYDVVTDFPQTNADGAVTYITLPKTRDGYATDSALVADTINEFNRMYPDYDGSTLDRNSDGAADNVLIIPTVPQDASILESDILWPHKADYPGSSGLAVGAKGQASEVVAYNIINTKSLDNMGVVAHEYMHSLGIKDYYRKSGSGNPVDAWDIMERSAARSWPLAITRQKLGWTAIPEQSKTGTYTLYEPGTGREQAFAFKSPLSDTEYFVVEYRKKNTDVNSLDTHIGGTGLIVYRVNSKFDGEGNIQGNDYVYVFRPGETGLGDARGNALNAQISSKGDRTSIGASDFGADITQGALCYSDGRNSGIVIEATGETSDSLTFKLTYPDYDAMDLWGAVGSADGVDEPLGTDTRGVQLVADGGDLYALIETSAGASSNYRVKVLRESAWIDLGVAAAGLTHGQLAVKDGAAYVLGVDYADGQSAVMLKTFHDGMWDEAAHVRLAGYANAPTLGFVGSRLYVILDRDSEDAKLYAYETGALAEASPVLPVAYVTGPAVFELNGHPAVACGDFKAAHRLVYELVDGAWTERSSIAGNAHTERVASLGDTTYVYQSANTDEAPSVTSFGSDGAKISTTMLPSFQRYAVGSTMVASGNRLYVAVIDNGSTNNAVRVYSANASDLSVWDQVGEDAYKPAEQVSAAVWAGKLVVGVRNDSTKAAWVRAHELVQSGGAEPPQPPAATQHTARFVADGAVVEEVVFNEGDAKLSHEPLVPEKTGYSGGWAAYALGSSDLVIEASYVPNRYTITFKNWDDHVLSSEVYEYGDAVFAPRAVRPDEGTKRFAFTGWSPAFSGTCDQTQDMVYTAQYREGTTPMHMATFVIDGKVVDRVEFFEGGTLTEPSVPQKTGYTGVWEAYALGTRDLTVRAVYTAKAYTVTFKNWNNDVLSSRSYAYGSAVAAPTDPTRPDSGGKTYAFVGWSPTLSSVCNGDAVYTAQYSERAIEHTVTFIADGKTVGATKFNEVDRKLIGSEPAPPIKTGYTGTWPSYTLGNQDVMVSATYRANRYAVTFKNWDGSTLQTGTYEYRSLVKAPLASRPSSDGEAYEFIGWSPTFSGICERAENTAYTAQYRARSIVHYVAFEVDGAVIDRVPFSEGDARLSRVPAVPSKAGYAGVWEPYSLGSGDIVVRARYSLQPNALTLATNAHVQNKGWIGYRGNGSVVGTTGSSLRMESIRVRLDGALASSDAISVQAHVQNIGWMSGLGNDKVAGTTGRSLRIEAMKLTLNSRLSLMGYRVYYRVHAQNVGWMGWAHDGAAAGTAGNSLRLEAIQIVLVVPGEIAPANAYGGVSSAETHPYIDSGSVSPALSSALSYDGMVHVQNIGNVSVATNGARTLGTTGRGLRLEGLKLSCPVSGVDLSYRTHVQNIGWQNWVGEGALSGTQGRALRLEALQIELSGSAAGSYDVYYRTHVQNIGWTGWARNGQQCGSAGYGYRMEAVQVMIVPKDGAAPGLCKEAFYRR